MSFNRPRFTVVPFNFPAGMHRLWWFPSDLNGDCISYELSVLPLDQGTVGACLSRLSPVCPGCIGSPVGVEPTHAKKRRYTTNEYTVAFGNSNHCFIVSPFAEATRVCMTLHSIQGCNDSPKPQLLFVMLRTLISAWFSHSLQCLVFQGPNFTALNAVLGDYAGTINIKVLTTDQMNKGASLATLRGKRLVISGERQKRGSFIRGHRRGKAACTPPFLLLGKLTLS